MFFAHLTSKLIYLKYFEIFKIAAILGFGRVFKPEVVTEVESGYSSTEFHPFVLRHPIHNTGEPYVHKYNFAHWSKLPIYRSICFVCIYMHMYVSYFHFI